RRPLDDAPGSDEPGLGLRALRRRRRPPPRSRGDARPGRGMAGGAPSPRRTAALGPSADRGRRRMTFDEVRASFPVLERVAYLNAGTFGPLARGTIEAVRARQLLDMDLGRAGPHYRDQTAALRAGARPRLAALLGVDPAKVALTQSS